MKKVLLPHQFDRLKQIDLQTQIQHRGASALTSGDIAKTLNLTDEQREKLEKRAAEVQEELQTKIRQLQADARKKMLDVLTPEQQAQARKTDGRAVRHAGAELWRPIPRPRRTRRPRRSAARRSTATASESVEPTNDTTRTQLALGRSRWLRCRRLLSWAATPIRTTSRVSLQYSLGVGLSAGVRRLRPRLHALIMDSAPHVTLTSTCTGYAMEAGSILVKRGLLSPQQLTQLRLDRPETTRLDVAAVDLGLVSEEAALRALGDEVGIPFVDLEQQKIDLSLLRGFPLKLIHRHSLFPLRAAERHAARRHQRPVRPLPAR